MSFDIRLMHFEGNDLAEANREAVGVVLSQYSIASNGDDPGQHSVTVGEDEPFVIFANLESDEQFNSCAFELRSYTVECCNFILKLAAAGDMVIFNCQGDDSPENPVMILSRPTQLETTPPLYENRIHATSGYHLLQLLLGSIVSWSEYRDQVTGRTSGEA